MTVRNIITIITLLIISNNAFARTAGEIGTGIAKTIEIWTVVLVIAASLIGIAIMIAGGLGLKKYADNPQQNPISKPLIYFISGIMIFGISATSETMKETIFGKEAIKDSDFEYRRDFGTSGAEKLS